jgi:hypothetical protein
VGQSKDENVLTVKEGMQEWLKIRPRKETFQAYNYNYNNYYYLYLAAIGLTAGGSSTVHVYTQTVHRIQRTEPT